MLVLDKRSSEFIDLNATVRDVFQVQRLIPEKGQMTNAFI